MSAPLPTRAELQARLESTEEELAQLELGVYQVGFGIAGYGSMSSEAESFFKSMRELMADYEARIAQLKTALAQQP